MKHTDRVDALAKAIDSMGAAIAQAGRDYAVTGRSMPSHQTFVKLAKIHNAPAAADIFERFFSAGYAAMN